MLVSACLSYTIWEFLRAKSLPTNFLLLLLDQANGLGHDFGQTRKVGFIRRRTENERRAEKTNTASGTKNTAVLLPRCARFEILS